MAKADKIRASSSDDESKCIALLSLTYLHYRQPEGDAAWEELRRMIGPLATNVLAFWMGMHVEGVPPRARLRELVESVTPGEGS